jgi:hypothetical protein
LVLSDADGVPGGEESVGVAIYDLVTDSLSRSFTAADLRAALLGVVGSGIPVTDGSDPVGLSDLELDWMWFLGWSADGQNLLVWAQAAGDDRLRGTRVILATIPLQAFGDVPLEGDDVPAARLLAYGQGRFLDAAWSPVDPNRLTFSWTPSRFHSTLPDAYILDLDAGPIHTAPQSWTLSWSPDGEWLAFGRNGQVTIADADGEERFQIAGPQEGWCSELAWNPVADLGQLREMSTDAP